jgi:hypothetical protein
LGRKVKKFKQYSAAGTRQVGAGTAIPNEGEIVKLAKCRVVGKR